MDYLTVKQVAELKGCSERYIQRIVQNGKLEAIQELNPDNNCMQYKISVSALPEELKARYYKRKQQELGLQTELKESETALEQRSKGIKSSLVTEELAMTVWERIRNYVYKSWHCDMADVTYGSYLHLMGALIFTRDDIAEDSGSVLGRRLFATTTEFSCDSTGVYFSGGAAPYDDWNYQSYLERRKVGIGKNVGNTAIATNGDIIFRNLNKGGGLNEHDNGISICVRNRNQ